MDTALDRIRAITRGTPFEGRVYLVGGAPRDRELGLPLDDDIDLVVEGDAIEAAELLRSSGETDHAPVVYPRFGTAMVAIRGVQVELVSARSEQYDADSRKPHVVPAALRDDAYRRDFTINTLMENLHTGARLDLTGRAVEDLRAGIIRTPLDPGVTFRDDPLRMLRAVRFAARFGFAIEPETWDSIRANVGRIDLVGSGPRVVSAERVRDEFCKMLLTSRPAEGMRMLLEVGLLAQVAPELVAMVGVTQNAWHHLDVWEHTLLALSCVGHEASLEVRLAVLLHDAGKPHTRTEDARGVHFYEHQFVSAEIAGRVLGRLRLPNAQVDRVGELVRLHMRLGEARPEWSEAAMRRLVRDTAAVCDDLFAVARADHAAMRPGAPVTDLAALRERIDRIAASTSVVTARSPLDGAEVMAVLGVQPGPEIGRAKAALTDAVVDGRLEQSDTEGARALLLEWWKGRHDRHQ